MLKNINNELEIDFLESITCDIHPKTSDTQLVVLKSDMFIQLETGKMEKAYLRYVLPFKYKSITKIEQIEPEIEKGKDILLEFFRKFEKEKKWTVKFKKDKEIEAVYYAKTYYAKNPLKVYFEKQSIEVKKKKSIEIPETYIECQSHYGFSLKTCTDCALKSQKGCGKIREDIMNFYLEKI